MHKRLVALLGVALIPISADAVAAQAPTRDSSSGSGRVLQTNFIGAGEAGPNGESPVGSLSLSGYLTFRTVTTCLNISGNAVVAGGLIVTGRDAGTGFLSSSVDNGRPRDGKPVDVTVFSGRLPRPPRNCPSPGDPPPPALRSTGGGPFISGDITVVDAVERVPADAPRARVAGIRLVTSPIRGLATSDGLTIRLRVCGAPEWPS
jgi:hypothetical protein